jgi:hypothetical protein
MFLLFVSLMLASDTVYYEIDSAVGLVQTIIMAATALPGGCIFVCFSGVAEVFD